FSGRDRVFYVVEDPSGKPVTGYADLADDLPETQSAEPEFIDGTFHNESVRIASVGRLVSSASATGWVTIRVAETRGEREALAAEIPGNAIIPVIALKLLPAGRGW